VFLTFNQKFSYAFGGAKPYGAKAGEYGGKETSRAPMPSSNGRITASGWIEQFAITTQAPAHKFGTRRVATNASKVSPSQAPSTEAEATTPVRRGSAA